MTLDESTPIGALLPYSFYARPTLVVARELLGCHLVRQIVDRRISARIVEVEAYVGTEDRACHAHRGLTPRTGVMFGPAGYAYVYLVYGMHYCLNIVTETPGFPAAVLIRALEPAVGLPADVRLDGPGRLCRGLSVDCNLNRQPVTERCTDGLWVEDRGTSPRRVSSGPRIGVAYAGEWAALPWRLWDAESHFITGTVSTRGSNGSSARPSRKEDTLARSENR